MMSSHCSCFFYRENFPPLADFIAQVSSSNGKPESSSHLLNIFMICRDIALREENVSIQVIDGQPFCIPSTYAILVANLGHKSLSPCVYLPFELEDTIKLPQLEHVLVEASLLDYRVCLCLCNKDSIM